MSLRSHVYAILNLLSKGTPSNNTNYSPQLVAHLLYVARAQFLDAPEEPLEEFIETLCLDMEKSKDLCGTCPPYLILWRSKQTIPSYKQLRIHTLDGKSLSPIHTPEMSLYNHKELEGTYYVRDGRVYVIGKSYEKLIAEGIFTSFDGSSKGSDFDGPSEGIDDCNLSQNFNIPSKYITAVYSWVLESLNASKLSGKPKDDAVNNKDDG